MRLLRAAAHTVGAPGGDVLGGSAGRSPAVTSDDIPLIPLSYDSYRVAGILEAERCELHLDYINNYRI